MESTFAVPRKETYPLFDILGKPISLTTHNSVRRLTWCYIRDWRVSTELALVALAIEDAR
jgi:predicted signal transduction protein with EAL and GGDEF domain